MFVSGLKDNLQHMKKLLLLIVISGLYINAFGQYKYEVNGTVNDLEGFENKGPLKQGSNIVLDFVNIHKSDTTQINNHTFSFKGEISEPSIAMLEYKYGAIKILIDSNSYNINFKVEKSDSVHFVYKGSITTQSKFHNLWKNFNDSLGMLYQSKNKLLNAIEMSKNTDSINDLKNKIREIDDKRAFAFKSTALNNPDNFAIAYILSGAPDLSYKNYIGIYDALSEKVKTSYYGKKLLGKLNAIKTLDSNDDKGIAEKVKEKELITIQAIDPASKKVELNKAFYKKNRYTYIDFWASWCSPCRKAIVDLRAKQESYLKKGLTIVGFSLDTDLKAWQDAIKEDKATWLQISDLKATQSPIVKFLNITAIPDNVLLNSEGEIIARNILLMDLDNLLNR